MAMTATADQTPATPEKIWATLDRLAERQAEYDRRWEREITLREEAAAKRCEEEAKRREEEAEREAKRQAEEAKRREEETEREAKRQAEEAKRREEEAERHRKSELELERLLKLFGETDRKIKENDKRVGGLGRSYGKLVEHLVGPGIVKRFGEHGYRFDGIKKQRYKLFDEEGNTETDIDLLLENENTIIAVEVKSRPDKDAEYLGRHLERLEIMRAHGKEEGWEGKRILGAIAGAIFETPMRNATLKAGLFVIEQSDDTMKMEVPEGFKPKVW